MILLPTTVLLFWILGCIALAIPATGIWLILRGAIQRRPIRSRALPGSRYDPLDHIPFKERGSLRSPLAVLGILLVVYAFAGRHLVLWVYPDSANDPRSLSANTSTQIARKDGGLLHVETFGPADAPTLILTHRWGSNLNEWSYAQQQLAGRFRLVVWDLPGMGQSTPPSNNDYSLDKFADDLDAVVQSTGDAPVILAGHSLGGMISLAYCRNFPAKCGTKIAGLALFDSTYTNPAHTTSGSDTAELLQKPIGEPLLYMMIPLSPLVRLMNWFAYHSGLIHMQIAADSFAGTETRGQLDFAARQFVQVPPSVLARGTLGMLHWKGAGPLKQLKLPVLLVVGAQDTTTPPEASESMKKMLPNSKLVNVEPAAHLGPIEQYARYYQELAAFATGALTRPR